MPPSRRCRACGLDKPIEAFPLYVNGIYSGRRHKCTPCYALQNKEWRKANHHRGRGYMLAHRYGIDEDEYSRMFAEQDGKCAICKSPKPGHTKSFHVDHDHCTGRVRGLLCGSCNRGLGSLGEDNLEAAINYLKEHH